MTYWLYMGVAHVVLFVLMVIFVFTKRLGMGYFVLYVAIYMVFGGLAGWFSTHGMPDAYEHSAFLSAAVIAACMVICYGRPQQEASPRQ